METCRRRELPDKGFTFPLVEVDDDCLKLEFESDSITPDSPFDGLTGNSPADHLFLNEKLLPHVFPGPKSRAGVSASNISRNPSLASSMSSKDFSGLSSQSNSTNSRSSTCSGRTSSSDSSERSMSASLIYCHKKSVANMRIDGLVMRESDKSRGSSCNAMEASYLCGYQRWQFITPAPSLSRETSSKRRKQGEHVTQTELKKTPGRKKRKGIFRKFVRSFLSSCMQCHAMEPSGKGDVRRQN